MIWCLYFCKLDTSISNELGKKLKDQVNLTKELDSQLKQELNKQIVNEEDMAYMEIPESIKVSNRLSCRLSAKL